MKNWWMIALLGLVPIGCTDGGEGGAVDAGPAGECGNGIREQGEECDDNNRRNRDGCSRDCKREDLCGNGRVDPGEECDDGNSMPDDGCSPDCEDEVVVDGNDSFDDAQDVTGQASVREVISRPGDIDYFRFTATEGDWLFLRTNANRDDNPDMIDTVITLYNADRTQVAENDDAYPRNDVDSEIIYLVPSTGTYYAKLQEFSTWKGDRAAEGGPQGYSYQLIISPLAVEDSNSGVVDAEAGDDASSAQAMVFSDRG